MSRIAKEAILLPNDLNVEIKPDLVVIKNAKNSLELKTHKKVKVEEKDNVLKVEFNEQDKDSVAQAGTTRALLNNIVLGLTKGFSKTLVLNGVGYRAALKGSVVNLTLGFSHPVNYALPDGITAKLISQTELEINGIEKQKVGQVAAEIRQFRKPEPFKGKGIRYKDEVIRRKEAKKK